MREVLMKLFRRLLPAILFFPAIALAQQGNPQQSRPCMPEMSMPECAGTGLITMQPQNFLQKIVRHTTSGTSAEPISTPSPMLMGRKGRWMLMFHANVFVLAPFVVSRHQMGVIIAGFL